MGFGGQGLPYSADDLLPFAVSDISGFRSGRTSVVPGLIDGGRFVNLPYCGFRLPGIVFSGDKTCHDRLHCRHHVAGCLENKGLGYVLLRGTSTMDNTINLP
jgi:hypothetical protein